jgi:hypothetical protein
MAESCSSLFINDVAGALRVKKESSLEFIWKLHLQWRSGVFCVIMVVYGLMEHHG